MWSEIAVIALALVSGWIALAPLRRHLGVWGYHVSALPVGLLVWGVMPAITSTVDVRYTPLAVAVVHVALVGGTAVAAVAVARRIQDEDRVDRLPAWSWLVTAATTLGAAVAIGFADTTAVRFDSLFHYHITGRWLAGTGQLDHNLMGEFTTLIPSLNAGTMVFGGDWSYIFYPMFGLSALALLAGVLYADAYRALRRTPRLVLTAVTILILATLPNWVWLSLYVHSNIASAAYLTLAVTALIVAAGLVGRATPRPAWSLVAGLGGAGLVLARPDGLAFLYVVLALAIVLLLGGWLSRRAYVTACTAALVPTIVVYGAGYLELGVWDSYKLSGSMVLPLLVGAVVLVAAGGVASRLPGGIGGWLVRGHNAIRLAAVANIVIVSVVAYKLRDKSVPEFRNMLGNLMDAGGWGFFWFAAFGIIVLSLVFWQVTRRSALAPYLLYAIAQFFSISLMVYGLTDPGRLSWADSFSRAAVHIVPVVFWYAGTFLGALAERDPQDVGVTA